MPTRLTLGILGAALMLCACGGPNIQVERDPDANLVEYESYSWVAPEQQDVEDPILDSALLSKKVERAIRATLDERGFEATETNPDFYVTYHTASKEKLRTTGFNVGIGYSRFDPRWGYAAVFGPPEVRSYEEAVLIIDVVDAETDTLVWRGWETGRLSRERFSAEAVDVAVEQILSRFPIG
ncbi:MAG: DUF4136 domain-containing protein [Gammaproteobacteria bacterium]